MANPRTIARLEAQIQRRAAHCLQFELSDPRSGFVTITRVELAKDLTSAKVFYSVLGGEAERSKAEHMLEQAAGFIQRQVARVLQTRIVPHMRWVYDGSLEEAARLDRLIRDARASDRALRERAGLPPEPDAADPEPLDDDEEAPGDDADEESEGTLSDDGRA